MKSDNPKIGLATTVVTGKNEVVTTSSTALSAFEAREDLKQFGSDALLLFALESKYNIEDICSIASTSLVENDDDKKADLVHIDIEAGRAVIAQGYIAKVPKKPSAPSNKAGDLNTAIAWYLNDPIENIPDSIKSHAKELRQAISDRKISSLDIWYVHNLPESKNVESELLTVEHSAKTVLKEHYSNSDIEIKALEVGKNTLEEWYRSISTPICVNDKFTISIDNGFEIVEKDWKAYVTSIPAKLLYDMFKKYKTELFSANVRDYLGSRPNNKNINNGIKSTINSDPRHFWVFNNGITALVNKFREIKRDDKTEIHIEGISIVNGAQTTGAIGNLSNAPDNNAKVPIRFITCSNTGTVSNIVRYNNYQNALIAPDFRSRDPIQDRLSTEFKTIGIEYSHRRGGHEDTVKERQNRLPSITAGQSLAAFHNDPNVAYHEKTYIWEDNTLYQTYFNEKTSAKHIIFSYSLLKAVEGKRLELRDKNKKKTLTDIEEKQLSFFKMRGSIFLMTSAIAKCLEIFLSKNIPTLSSVFFKSNLSLKDAATKWSSIVNIASSFTEYLKDGLSDGFKKKEVVDKAIKEFQSLINATKDVNAPTYRAFADQVN